MMPHFFLIFSFLLFQSHGQLSHVSNIPILEKRLVNVSHQVQEIDVNLGLCHALIYESQNLDKALLHANKAIDLAKQQNQDAYHAIAMAYKAITLFYLGDENNLIIINQARKLAIKSKDPTAIAISTSLLVSCSLTIDEAIIDKLTNTINTYKDEISNIQLGRLYIDRAFANYELGQFIKAEENYLSALNYLENPRSYTYEKLGSPTTLEIDNGSTFLVLNYTELSSLKMYSNKKEEAYLFYEKALQAAKHPTDIARCYQALGFIQLNFGEFNNVENNLTKAIELYETTNNQTDYFICKRDLVEFYMLTKKYEEAEAILFETNNDFPDRPMFHQALDLKLEATIHEIQGEFEEAYDNYNEAATLFDLLRDEKAYRASQIGVANALFQLAETDKSEDILNNFLPAFKENNEWHYLLDSYFLLAQIKLKNKDYEQAISFANKALTIEEDIESNQIIKRKVHKLLSKIYEDQEDFEMSLHHLKSYYENELIFDKLLASTNENDYQNKVSEFIQNEQIAKEETQKLNKQKFLYLTLSFALLFFLLIGSYLFFQLQKSRKRIEEQNENLAKLNKTKDKFFALIAHDLRSPIGALKNVDKQMAFYAEKGDHKKMLTASRLVGQTSNKLLNLLDNLLKWALSESNLIEHVPKAINLKQAIDENIDFLENNAHIKGITLLNKVPEQISLRADRNSLHTIIRNLLTNSIKFSDAGDQVTLDAKKTSDQISFWVEDTGIGMTENQLNNIFKLERKINSGTQGESGTGLGLVLVRDLVLLHKGTISVNSEIAKGSKFEITFPV